MKKYSIPESFKKKLKYKCKCKTCYGGIKPFRKHNTDERGYCLNCQTEEKYNLYDFVNGKAVNNPLT